jgi:hypothetical protein
MLLDAGGKTCAMAAGLVFLRCQACSGGSATLMMHALV